MAAGTFGERAATAFLFGPVGVEEESAVGEEICERSPLFGAIGKVFRHRELLPDGLRRRLRREIK